MEELFDNDFFVIIGTVSDKDSLTDSIEECGGIISKTINKKTTLAICNDIDDDNNKVELDKVKKNGTIKIITDSFLLESIKEKKRLNVDDYITKSKATSGGDSNGGSASTDSGDTDEQVIKRVKLDHLISGSVWCGALNYINTGDIYPFYLNIETRVDDQNLIGTIDWPTLENAKTEFRATLVNDTLKIDEHTQITTTDQVSLPNSYEAKVIHGVKPQIKGSIVYPKPEDNDDPDLKATFNLNLTKPKSVNSVSSNNLSAAAAATTTVTTPAIPLELSYLIDGNQFNGEFEIPYGFNLKIVGRKNQRDIDGTIDWTNLKTKTKFKGELNEKDLSIVLQEYEILSGDSVEVPITYTGVLSNDKNLISGDYKVDGTSTTGKFKLELIQK